MKALNMVMEKIKETELKSCPICKGKIKKTIEERNGIALAGYKCERDNEVFFPSGEIVKYEILSGRRKPIRKIGKVGNSIIIRIPSNIAKEFGIRKGSIAYFEKREHEIDIKILHK